jgi:hypothetical protein
MHRIVAVGEIHRLGYVKPPHSNEGLTTATIHCNLYVSLLGNLKKLLVIFSEHPTIIIVYSECRPV